MNHKTLKLLTLAVIFFPLYSHAQMEKTKEEVKTFCQNNKCSVIDDASFKLTVQGVEVYGLVIYNRENKVFSASYRMPASSFSMKIFDSLLDLNAPLYTWEKDPNFESRWVSSNGYIAIIGDPEGKRAVSVIIYLKDKKN